jgi:hypothetical protein|tara:strand:- start:1666 stop:1863 length:198 start_codon:yes stop_codon:yes gene_type:complete
MHGCEKCSKICGYLVLALGILFLLQDMGKWAFFGISWYTALFLLIGVGKLGSGSCKGCQAEAKKK